MVRNSRDECGSTANLGLDRRTLTLPIAPTELCAVFGVKDPAVASRLLSQLVNVLHPDSSRPIDIATINQALELVRGIGPTGVLEALTATLLVATQHAATDAMRRALHPDQTPGGRGMYLTLGLKGARTFGQLSEGFNRASGKGVTTQNVVVTHVTVEAGAQAVVGAVSGGRG